MTTKQTEKSPLSQFMRRTKLLLIPGLIVLVALFILAARRTPEPEGLTFQAFRGNLRVAVLEGGSLRALRNIDISSRVQGQTTILEIADEGTIITREDVEQGKILVKLDDSQFEERLAQEEIKLHNAEASLIESRENLAIQKNRNASNIRAGELTLEFARMDLEKFLGEKVTHLVLTDPTLNFSRLVDHPELAGEAERRKKQLQSTIELAREELSRARDRLEWTEKLEASGYATRSELEADRLAMQRRQVEIEQAEMAYDLFVRYDFPKEITRFLSDYQEAHHELERITANARAQLAQAESRLITNGASYRLTQTRVRQIQEQIDGCIIRAPQPGIVVYATSTHPWRTQQAIEPGANVRQFQNLIQLPDLSEMVVEMNVSEASIDRIARGQQAAITVDAFPDRRFTGRVHRIGILPDASMRMLNPDINVYKVDVLLNESDPDLRPGMSARAEILITEAENVLMVPVSAVRAQNDAFQVTRLDRGRPAPTPVTLGKSNDNFVEITGGLNEGDVVQLYAQAGLPAEAVERTRFERLAPEISEEAITGGREQRDRLVPEPVIREPAAPPGEGAGDRIPGGAAETSSEVPAEIRAERIREGTTLTPEEREARRAARQSREAGPEN